MSKYLSTDEITKNALLMNLLSTPEANRAKLFDMVLASAKVKENEPRYEVEIRINGVEFDCRAWTRCINDQMDEAVLGAAHRLIEERFGLDGLAKASMELAENVQQLAHAVDRKLRDVLGIPHSDEDSR